MTDEHAGEDPAPRQLTSREQWLEARAEGLGASDTGSLFGHWGSPLQLYSRILKLIPEQEHNEYMAWGQRIEPLIRDHYGRESGRIVQRAADVGAALRHLESGTDSGSEIPAFSPEADELAILLAKHCEVAYGPDDEGRVILRSKERPWQMFTPDGFCWDEAKGWGTLQVKCTAMKDRWSDGLPEYHVPQAVHEQAVSGLGYTSFAVLFNGNNFDWIDHDRDDEAVEEVNAAELAFWTEHVLKGEAPAADGSKATAETLRHLYPNDNGETAALPADALAWDEEYCQAKAEKKAAELRMKAAETRLKASIGDSTWGTLPNGQQYSLKTTVQAIVRFDLRRVDAEVVAEALALLAKERPAAVFLKVKVDEKLEKDATKWRTLRRLSMKSVAP